MFCIYCGNEIPNDAGFCPKCGKSLTSGAAQQPDTRGQNKVKNKKKGIAIAGVILASMCLLVAIASLAIGFYKGDSGQLRSKQDNVDNSIEKEDIHSERESKVYKVISSAKITKEDMKSIVYNLQRRADNYTTEAVVLMKQPKSDWYVEISMPGVSDDAYKEVVRNVELQFIGGYGTDSEEIVVTNQNIKSASVSVVENSVFDTKDYVVGIVFDDEGTKAFAEGTTKLIGQKISIVLDGEVISEPYVQCVITGGEAQIISSSYEEAESLATLLRVGYIGFDLEEVE